MLKLSINFEGILSRADVNSEKQNKAYESSTIISNDDDDNNNNNNNNNNDNNLYFIV